MLVSSGNALGILRSDQEEGWLVSGWLEHRAEWRKFFRQKELQASKQWPGLFIWGLCKDNQGYLSTIWLFVLGKKRKQNRLIISLNNWRNGFGLKDNDCHGTSVKSINQYRRIQLKSIQFIIIAAIHNKLHLKALYKKSHFKLIVQTLKSAKSYLFKGKVNFSQSGPYF